MSGSTIDNNTELSALHFDLHKSDSDRALLFVFDEINPFPKYVAKYAKDPKYEKHLCDQFDSYSQMYNSFSPNLGLHLPKPIGVYDESSTIATIEEGVPGRTLENMIKYYGESKKILNYFKAAFDFLVALHDETRIDFHFSDEAIHKFIDTPLSLFFETYRISPNQRFKIETMKQDVVDYLLQKSILVSCHGDFWPNNILVHNNVIYIVDWALTKEKYLIFWDTCSLIYSVNFKTEKLNSEFKELNSYYLRKYDIYRDIESEIRIIYYAIRSVWNNYWHGIHEDYDRHWKIRIDKELNN